MQQRMVGKIRRDKKKRILRAGESQRDDGRYQYKYSLNGRPHFFYSWKLEPTDPLPKGKKPCKSLREMEEEFGMEVGDLPNIFDNKKTVLQLVERYISLKKGVKPNTMMGYKTVINILKKDPFSEKEIGKVKKSDAKLWIIGMQQNEGKSFSTIHTIRGVVRPAFQMAVDDDILRKNPFDFQMKDALINDSVKREAVSRKDMRIFLDFVKNSRVYYKYYDAMFVLFHTGMRISEFCGLTVNDIDLENRTINIDHQLMRDSRMNYYIISTKTTAGTRVLPMTDEVYEAFSRILKNRKPPKVETIIDGYSNFLYYDLQGKPMVALHWEKYFQHALERHNEVYKYQLPKITPHVCRHTYCTNMALSGISPKTLQYLMGHSDIAITLNVYTHIKFDDAKSEVEDLQSRQEKETKFAREELEKMGKATPKAKVIPMRKEAN